MALSSKASTASAPLQKHRLSIRPLDYLMLVLSILALVLAVYRVRGGVKSPAYVVISCPSGDYLYPLTRDASYDIQGAIGTSIIQVKDGAARFIDSPCPNRTCIACPPISYNYEWTACMPNQVFIRIEGAKDANKLDTGAF